MKFAAALLLLVPLAAHSEDLKPGSGYRGIAWGTPVIEAMRILEAKDQSMTCPAGPATLVNFECGGVALIGDALVQNTFIFEDGKLSGVLIRFDSTDYRFLRTVFMEKFGSPTKADTSVVQNLAGATLNAESLSWTTSASKVVMIERLDSMTKGLAAIGPAAWFDRFAKIDKERTRKATGDF